MCSVTAETLFGLGWEVIGAVESLKCCFRRVEVVFLEDLFVGGV